MWNRTWPIDCMIPANFLLSITTYLCFWQVHVQYNVPSTRYEQCAFNITVNARTKASSNIEEGDREAIIAVCARYALYG